MDRQRVQRTISGSNADAPLSDGVIPKGCGGRKEGAPLAIFEGPTGHRVKAATARDTSKAPIVAVTGPRSFVLVGVAWLVSRAADDGDGVGTTDGQDVSATDTLSFRP